MNEYETQENIVGETASESGVVLPPKQKEWCGVKQRDFIIFIIFLAIIGFAVANRSVLLLKNSVLSNNLISVKKTDYFAGINIEAKGIIVWDAKEDKIIFGKNEHMEMPLASLTKIMTVFLALESGENKVVVSKEDVLSEGDSGLLVGEEWQPSELAKLTLVVSANDGASSLASAWVSMERAKGSGGSFIGAMNARAKSLGLSEILFSNETGLDASLSLPGAYGSADNVAKLFYLAVKTYPAVFEATSQQEISVASLSNKIYKVKNTNRGVGEIPGVIASKTGFTDLAGGNLVVMFDAGLNHPVVSVVLGSTEKGRFDDIKKLIAATILNIGEK